MIISGRRYCDPSCMSVGWCVCSLVLSGCNGRQAGVHRTEFLLFVCGLEVNDGLAVSAVNFIIMTGMTWALMSPLPRLVSHSRFSPTPADSMLSRRQPTHVGLAAEKCTSHRQPKDPPTTGIPLNLFKKAVSYRKIG